MKTGNSLFTFPSREKPVSITCNDNRSFPVWEKYNRKIPVLALYWPSTGLQCTIGIVSLQLWSCKLTWSDTYREKSRWTGLLCIICTCSQKQFSRFQHSRHCPSRFSLDHNRIERNESAFQLQDIPIVCTPPLRHTYPIHHHKLNPRFRGDRFQCCPKEK